jgi:hypothetical protein
MRVIVTGLIGTYPLGGVAWDYLQFVKGFRLLGCDVTYLEDTKQWAYDPVRQTFTEDCRPNVEHLQRVLARVPGMERSFAFRDPSGRLFGLDEEELGRRCREADLLLNVSGSIWPDGVYREPRVVAYYDSDPLYTQAVAFAPRPEAPDEVPEWIRRHDVFFTMAENLRGPGSTIPDCGLDWKLTRQPITLDDWSPTHSAAGAERFTTVMSWKTSPKLPVIGGRTFGGKDVEFFRFLELPSRTSATLEIAVSGPAPRDRLVAAGWQVVDAWERSSTMEIYRDYIAGSSAEWSIAKEAYVASASGWFSCRSACYLATGKPVVVQDTGFSSVYPRGEGIWPFATIEEAVAAFDGVRADYARQCEAARATAERYFRAETVLERLLRDAGL